MATTTWTQTAGMTSDEDTDNLESYAEQAEASKDAAAASETAAAASATAAAASEVDAESAEANASASETAAAASAASATSSATAASNSASSASTSATAAASSATAASASEAAAAASESAAATSESNASTSETNAATSASNASTSETNAANSATAAAASATEAQGYADSINPDNIDINGGTIDGTVIGGTTPAAGSFTNITATGTVDGRDVSADGTKLDTIETNADVTDTTNVTAAGALMTTGGTMTGDVAYGDNVKATFGAGSDLEIFHQSSNGNSIIRETGGGSLSFQTNGPTIAFYDSVNAYTLMELVTGAGTQLRHDGNLVFGTTATGINVTGNVVADGLTVQGTNVQTLIYEQDGTYNPRLATYFDVSGTHIQHTFSTTASTMFFENGGAVGSGVKRMSIGSNGDISFYEDTGTTPKLTWDASAEALAFGDNVQATFGSSADLKIYHNGSNSLIQDTGTGILEITSDGSQIKLSGNGSTSASFYINGESQLFCAGALKLATKSNGIDVTGNVGLSGSVDFGDWTITESGGSLYFATGGTNKMKLDASGNLQVVGNVESNATIS